MRGKRPEAGMGVAQLAAPEEVDIEKFGFSEPEA